MKRLTTLLLAVLITGQALLAQTVNDARQSLYHGKTKSAREALEKITASDPKNAEAIYWLGQAHIEAGDLAGAKTIYQNALNSGVNDPWILVGMGHVAVLEGRKDDARQRFEVAITQSINKKKENPAILNAIGRANADGPATAGDPAYAIDKLKRAAELDPNNPEIYINMGINYRKMGPERGTEAFEAYNSASRVDPKNARAKFLLGKIFQSQGNREQFLQYFNEAVAADPAYAPAYLELYDYYANRDVNKARENLEKYIANSDKDCNTDYLYADYLFRSGKYQESLQAAKNMENGACKDYQRLKVLYAYNYDRLGDEAQAKTYITSYMSSVSPDKIQPTDYLFAASVLKKSPGGEEAAIGYLNNALRNDTSRESRRQFLDTIASLYQKTGNIRERLNYLRQSFALNPSPTNLDIYNVADAAISARNFALADTMSRLYIQKYPEQEYGYSLLVRGAKAADSTRGTSFAAIQQYIDFLSRDAAKNADKIKSQYTYMASIAADKMKDYRTALEAVNKILAIDPNDQFASQARPVLEKAVSGKGSSGSSSGGAKKPVGKKGK